jgi:hypothetical protein
LRTNVAWTNSLPRHSADDDRCFITPGEPRFADYHQKPPLADALRERQRFHTLSLKAAIPLAATTDCAA